MLERQHDLWCSVPPSSNIFGHEAGFRAGGFRGLHRPRESKIADLQVAVGVEEQIRWFEITVDDIGRVQRLKGAKCLIDKVLRMVIGQVLCSDDTVHVGLHQLLDH